MPEVIAVKKLFPFSKVPTKAVPGDAGFDLYATHGGQIWPGDRLKIPTGIAIAIPRGYEGRVSPRSGLADNKGLEVLGGVVDHGYTGEVHVILINSGHEGFVFNEGDRIAQLVVAKIHEADELVVVAELPTDTARGDKGFGSSGE